MNVSRRMTESTPTPATSTNARRCTVTTDRNASPVTVLESRSTSISVPNTARYDAEATLSLRLTANGTVAVVCAVRASAAAR